MNKVIRILIISDFFLLSGWGLIAPIFAIFITQQIKGGDAQVAGIAAGIYWITKAVLLPFVGKYLDRNHGEKDDFWFMFGGLFIASIVPIGFIFASTIPHIYFLQFIHAAGMALASPSWGAVFVRHIDKGKEALEYASSSTAISFGAGVAAITGGWVVVHLGYPVVFVAASIFSFASAFILFLIAQNLFPFDRQVPRLPIGKVPHVPMTSIFQKWSRLPLQRARSKKIKNERQNLP